MNDDLTATENYTRAVLLHRRITANVQAAQDSLYEACRDMKELRDGRLYEELGYASFEDYCTAEFGLSYKQAMKYIAVAERYPEGFSPGRMGISKLYLLSSLSEDERGELAQRVDVEEVSKAALEKAIADLKAENRRLEEEKQMTFEELEKLKNKPNDVSQAKERIEYLRGRLEEQEKLTEKESKQREDAACRASIAETDRDELRLKVSQLEDKIKELKDRDPETVTVIDTTETDRLKEELERARKRLEERPEPTVEKVEVKDDKEVFKAYLSAAVDSVQRLMDYIGRYEGENRELFREKAEMLGQMIEEKLR